MRSAAFLALLLVTPVARAQDVVTPWGRYTVERDAAGRARAVRGPFGAVALEHDADGRRRRVARTNGTTTTIGPAEVEHLGPRGEVVLRVTREPTPDGEAVRVVTDRVREVRVARDGAGRVIDVVSDEPTDELHLIPAPDGLRVERGGASERWVVDEGRLVAAGDLRLRHDARGRVVRVEGPPGEGGPAFVITYGWDEADRLVRARRVTPTSSTVVVYAWSDEGRLVERQGPGGVTRVVEGGPVRAHLGPRGDVRLDVLDPDAPDGAPPLAVFARGAWWFAHDDGRGSVLAWTDAQGRRVEEVAFSPWGEPRAGSGGLPLVWCGREVDVEAGLALVRGRPYAPWLGRWLSPDPAAPRGRAYASGGIVGALGAAPTR